MNHKMNKNLNNIKFCEKPTLLSLRLVILSFLQKKKLNMETTKQPKKRQKMYMCKVKIY